MDLCFLECCNKYTVFIIMYIIYCISVIMKNTLLKTITAETEDGGAGLELFSGFLNCFAMHLQGKNAKQASPTSRKNQHLVVCKNWKCNTQIVFSSALKKKLKH